MLSLFWVLNGGSIDLKQQQEMLVEYSLFEKLNQSGGKIIKSMANQSKLNVNRCLLSGIKIT